MKALVVYDSYFGNTEKVAQAIGQALGSQDEVEVRRASDVQPQQLAGLDVLVVGSPTRAFQATQGVKRLLRRIPARSLKGVRTAAFDTRVSIEDVDSAFLTFMVNLFGYAAEPIARRLQRKGADQALAPEGFIVEGTEGPMREGELERAADWASRLVAPE
jgi:flavodoxin